MTTRTAKITWLTPDQGGRRAPPSGPQYIAPARFIVAADRSSYGNWGLVVDLVSRPAASNDWIAKVRFLVGEAPHEWLADGTRFELYEGTKRVAQGNVLPDGMVTLVRDVENVVQPTHENNVTG